MRTMRTTLYLPFKDFQINNKDGTPIIYESLIRNGPSYKLVVHESDSWNKFRDSLSDKNIIEIISKKEEELILETTDRYFSSITESIPYIEMNGRKYPSKQLTTDFNRALSYFYIAHHYKARILGDDFIKDINLGLSKTLKEKEFSDEDVQKIALIEGLVSGYKTEEISTLSINKDRRIINDLLDLLEIDEIKTLSELNYNYGLISVKKDQLIRKSKELITDILQKEYLKYIIKAPFLISSFYMNQTYLFALSFIGDIVSTLLKGSDFREYAPPIDCEPIINNFGIEEGLYMYGYFNYKAHIFTTPPKINNLLIKDFYK